MSFSRIVGVVLILGGAYACYVGNQHRNSLTGEVASLSVKVANKVDGASRVADHTWYFVGGGALMVVGAFILTRRASQ